MAIEEHEYFSRKRVFAQFLAHDDAEGVELRDMTRRFWIGAVLTLPVFLLAMSHLIPALGRQAWLDSEGVRLARVWPTRWPASSCLW